jgi:hypothetical protein
MEPAPPVVSPYLVGVPGLPARGPVKSFAERDRNGSEQMD